VPGKPQEFDFDHPVKRGVSRGGRAFLLAAVRAIDAMSPGDGRWRSREMIHGDGAAVIGKNADDLRRGGRMPNFTNAPPI